MSTVARKSYTRRNARTRIRDLLTEALELVDKHCVSSDTILTPKTATAVTEAATKTAAKLNMGLTPIQEENESVSLQATAFPPANTLSAVAPTPKTTRKYTQSNSRNAGIKLWNEKVTAYLAEQRAQGRKLTRPEAMAELKGKKGATAPQVSPTSARVSPTPGRLSPPSEPLNVNRI
jgi:hypothetical protein